jgi:hypothetical protein
MLLGAWAARAVAGSIPLLFMDERQATDDVFVEHAHQTLSFFIASPNLGPQAFIASLDLNSEAFIDSTNFGSHRRKLTANLLAELQELRLQASNLFGQRFEAFHATLQPIYPTGKSLRRHRRPLECGNCQRALVPRRVSSASVVPLRAPRYRPTTLPSSERPAQHHDP